MITQAPRGTKDWFGRDMSIRQRLEAMASEIAQAYNFQQIITPAFEHTNLFERGVGDATDIVQKEMYTFEDKGGRMISLKPEGTSPVIRAYLEHNLYAQPAPKKFYYFTQAFRYEKPASGRLRQHHQFGCELIGSDSPMAELEVIEIAHSLLKRLGLKGIRLHLNSIGEGDCRKRYQEALVNYLKQHEESLCPVCRERMHRNPLRVIDCKEASCQEIVKDAPVILDYLDEACQQHQKKLEEMLTACGIDFVIDTGVVRGLDYYTKTVFEFIDEDGLTICGGGRYDGLVHEIDPKQDVPAVGFGMGIERVLYFLEKQKIDLEMDDRPMLYLGYFPAYATDAAKLATTLRQSGIRTEVDLMGRSVRAQMKYANKIDARYVAIIGESEVQNRQVSLKKMETGESQDVAWGDLVRLLGSAGGEI